MSNPSGVRFRDKQTEDAWQVHRALLLAEVRHPDLRDNPLWQLLRMDTYETFNTMMGRNNGK